MPATTQGFSAFLAPDLNEVFIDTGKERNTEYSEVFNVLDMSWNPMTDRQISGLGTAAEKPEGQQFVLDQPLDGGTKTYTASNYGLAFEVTFEAWNDELYGVMRAMSAELARALRNRQELDAWGMLDDAFTTAQVGFTSGEALCATTHTALDGSTNANRPSPDVGFSVTFVQGAITRFETMNNERGLPRVMAPSMALVTPQNKFLAREILGSSGAPHTNDNELNSIVEDDIVWYVMHYLTSTTASFLMAAKGVHNLNYLWRNKPIFDSFDDPWTKNAIFTGYERFATGWGSWRGIDGTTG